jgi:carboxymethylenebutenolidase
MVEGAQVILSPILVGGLGHDQLRVFYSKYFLNQIPPDIALKPISRTVGQNRVVDEVHISFTHTCRMDFVLPGVPPTGKHIELVLVTIVQLAEDGKLIHEHLYWDQASVLVQAGLIEKGSLPVVGVEGPRQVMSPTHPMNQLAER